MSFHESSDDIRIIVEGCTILFASANNVDEESCEASLNLDDMIGNSDGYFSREVNGFTESAQNIELEVREDGPWLTADLLMADGEYRERQGINLAEHIGNNNGELVWV